MYYEIRNESAFNAYLKLWQQRTLQLYDYSNWLAANNVLSFFTVFSYKNA